MSHTVVDAADVEASFGAFRKMRIALGASGFGINQLELPPGASGRAHDEMEGGQEEVYVVLAGSGVMRIDGQDIALVPGRWLRVDPGHTRMPIAGSEGLKMIMVGGTPGRGYVPRANL
jgi:mannose-6-phosphate isomerase-like protein (cupin superfamily)